LDTNTSLEQFFTDINIPIHCQFLVAQPQSDHFVVLTEVYRVSHTLSLQTYCFGNWTAGGGLTWPSQSLAGGETTYNDISLGRLKLMYAGTYSILKQYSLSM
jgi:hypothetical protein